MSKMKTRN